MKHERIAAIRADLAADFGPRADRALERRAVRVRDEAVAGVPCHIVEPSESRVSGTVLHFFGGGYVSGKPEFDLPITAALAALAGVRIVAPRYALAPEHPFPAGLHQCLAVRDALAAEGAYSLSGESAGGGMALSVAHAGFATGTRRPDALVLFSPWSDLRGEATALCEGIDDPTLTGDTLRMMAACYLGERSPQDPAASPALATIPVGWPDTVLTTCSRDMLGPTVRRLADAITASGAVCELIDVEGLCHVFEAYDEFPESAVVLCRVADFLSARNL